MCDEEINDSYLIFMKKNLKSQISNQTSFNVRLTIVGILNCTVLCLKVDIVQYLPTFSLKNREKKRKRVARKLLR